MRDSTVEVRVLLSWVGAIGWAAEGPCAEDFTAEDLRVRLDSIDHAFAISENSVAERVTALVHEKVACLTHVADPAALRQLAWYEAFLAHGRHDEEASLASVRTALVAGSSPESGTRPPREIPSVVPATHPFRELADTEVIPPVVGEGSVVPPRGGGVFLGGALLTSLRGFEATPMLLQVADASGTVIAAQWVTGADLPADWVGPPGPVAKAPKWWGVDLEDTPTVDRRRQGLGKLPNVLAAVGVGLVAGGLYAAAAGSEGGLAEASDEASLAAARTRVNTLAVASIVVGGAAVGVGATAFLAGSPTLGLTVRF